MNAISNNIPIPPSEFSERIAVVTGAAQGIGLAVFERLLAEGATVIGLDTQFGHPAAEQSNTGRPATEAQPLRDPVFKPFDSSTPVSKGWCLPLDVSQQQEIIMALDAIESQFGEIHYVVHAAGILRLGHLMDLSTGDWQKTFAVNALGAWHFCSEAARYLRSRQQGAIVAVGSNASSTPRLGMGAYAASKAAATMMMKCLALELAPFNVRCNVVAPGSTLTPMQRQLWSSDQDAQAVIEGNGEQYRLGIPLGRIASPEQIADSVMFLLSERSSHITMEVLRVDGGATLGSL